MEMYLKELAEVIQKPHKAFREIITNPEFEHAIHVPLILSALGFISGLAAFMKITVYSSVQPSFAAQMFLFLSRYKLIILPTIFPILLCFIVAMIIHTIAELPCGAESTYEEAVTMVGFSMTPLAASALIKFLAAVVRASSHRN